MELLRDAKTKNGWTRAAERPVAAHAIGRIERTSVMTMRAADFPRALEVSP